jgi:hypothetical protein
MDPSHDRDHFAILTTLRGSVVSLPNLTEDQADAVAAQYGPPAERVPPAEASESTKQCGRCSGAGGWNEPVEVETGSGGKVVTQKWVNCRPCGGTGRVPK